MAVTEQELIALRELDSSSPVLNQAMILAMKACRDEVSLGTITDIAATLKAYDLADVEWCLGFMIDHPELHDFWAATVHRLNVDDFHLYLDRLDDLWERMASIPGVTTATAWSVLAGYREKDPGTTRGHGTAVFMINAALLTSMKAADVYPSETGATVHTRYSAFAGESLNELAPRMMDFAIERAADVDRIVEIILTENLWQPEALRYRLDGKLTPATAAEELAYPMVAKVCDSSPVRLENATTKYGVTNSMKEEQILSLNTTHTNSMILNLVEKTQSNDLESLHAHAALITDYCAGSVTFEADVLDMIISDLRKLGETDLSAIDKDRLYRVGKMMSMITLNSRTDECSFPKATKDEYYTSLRMVAGIGPETVQQYIKADYKRAIILALRHEATTHDALISVLEEAARHGALADGFI